MAESDLYLLEITTVLDEKYGTCVPQIVASDVWKPGLVVPIREGIAQHVFTVSSSDFMSVYAANNLFRGIQ